MSKRFVDKKVNPKSAVRLFLIDGSALAYRSYFAFIRNPLINSKGENTSAPFAFTHALLKILREEKPDYFAVVFDTPEATFRHKKYPAYKATREKMPDQMRDQLVRIRQIIAAFRIPIIEVPGYEADDIMGTLAKRVSSQGTQAVLVSGDKDFLQLVGEGVLILNPRRSGEEVEWIDRAGVRQRFGVEPEQVPEVLGLMGDTSDNVPGVPKIGEKTAIKLIRDYGSLEGVFENLAQISPKRIRDNLTKYQKQARLSRELVTIHTDAPVAIELDDLKQTDPDRPQLIDLFKELEFHSLLKAFTEEQASQADYQIIEQEEALSDLVQRIRHQGWFAVDVETTSLAPLEAELVGIAISLQPGTGYYIPIGHQEGGNLSWPLVRSYLGPLLEDPKIEKIGQNIKYDLIIFHHHGVPMQGIGFDTMVAAYLLDPGKRQFNLDLLALELLGYKKTPITDLLGKGKSQKRMDQVPVSQAASYACEDTDITLQLRDRLAPQLQSKSLDTLFREIELPLIPVLAELEINGIAIDREYLQEMSKQFELELQRLTEQIYTLGGEEFNINSTRQLGRILFDKLGLPVQRRTKTGYSTDVKVLETLAQQHELPQMILDYRQLAKLKSTYIDALPELVNSQTKRLHASFNQTVAETGRLSTSEPNLQNIPIRTEIGRQIRAAFIPGSPDQVLLCADYSQIELRLLAHICGDPTLREAFAQGLDVHTQTASLVFNLPQQEVTAEHRRRAKVVNFGIIYGMGPFGLAQGLKISVDEARVFIDHYFAQYPGVKQYIEETIARARRDGYVTTLKGRRRYLPDINADNRQRREFAERAAINMPIQGTAADLIKVAMIRISQRLHQEHLDSKMILQIHDELVFEVPANEVEQLGSLVREEMEQALPLSVPIVVDIGSGKNWLEAH